MTPNQVINLISALDNSAGWLETAGCDIGDALRDAEGWKEMEEAGKLVEQAFNLIKKAKEILMPLEESAREDLDYIEALADAASY